ncbi:MAG TPA: amidohydrolase, partial [Thermoplasmata archaeon]|nr:amidohydrolase [Thermoplasmata archaeon]
PDVPTGADRVDLAGRLVVPAFLDAHLHVTESALRAAGVDVRRARSLQEIGEQVRDHALRVGRGAVWGGGWDQDRLAERRPPTREDLDRWLPDRPLLLTRSCEHVAVVNSAGLAALGVDARTPEVPGGRIDRGPTGEPTGVLRERALRLLARFPFPRLADRPELGERFLGRCAALGLAAVAGLRASREEVDWMVGRGEARSGEGSVRYRAFGSVGGPGDIEAWGAARSSGATEISGIKLFADGSFGARSAWLESPYADAPEESGGPVDPETEWEESFRIADGLGLRVAVHALGDRGVRRALEAMEAVRPSRRPRIEHAGLVPEGLWHRFARAEADVVVQPGFRTSDSWLPERLGTSRIRSVYPWASMRRRGIWLGASSDAPVESLDPLEGIRSAQAREAVGEPLGVMEALELYTRGSAGVLGFEDLGHLEVGAAASLVALAVKDPSGLGDLPGGSSRSVWLDGLPVGGGPGG